MAGAGANPLTLLNSPPTTSVNPTATASGGVFSTGNVSTGTFNFGGASNNMLYLVAGAIALVYFIRKR